MNGEAGIDRSLRLPARDGFKLAATLYEPQGKGAWGHETLVVISSATAVPRSYYDGFSRFLAGRGFAVLAYDYRGIGGSRPRSLRGFQARMHQWGQEDLAGVIDWAGLHVQPARMLSVGHSVGGQLVGLAENNEKIGALLTVASQSGYWGHWPSPERWRIALYWHLIFPAVSRALGYMPGWMGMKEDLPGGVAREWAAWGRRPSFLQVHLVGVLREQEAERGTALRTERPPSDRRTVVPVGLAVPADAVEPGVDEGDRNRAGRALAHAAVAQIGLARLDLGGEPHPPAGAAAAHLLGHDSSPFIAGLLRG